jgi:hypothetical protein
MGVVIFLYGHAGTQRYIEGQVFDFDTGLPIHGAEVRESQQLALIIPQHGDYVTRKARTDGEGRFRLKYSQIEEYIGFSCIASGYGTFRRGYKHNSRVVIRLRKKVSGLKPLEQGYVRLRAMKDGTMYGWDFTRQQMTASEDSADILPTSIDAAKWGPLRVKTLGKAGMRFVSEDSLGVDCMFLNYSDTAPQEGYEKTASIRFHDKGGIYFFRTRDGRYAKIEFNPNLYSSSDVTPEVLREVDLRYLLSKEPGSRDLTYRDF